MEGLLLRAAAFALAGASLLCELRGQEETPSVSVVEVEIRGTTGVSEERIRDNLRTRPGRPFSEKTLSDDIKRLYENPDFRIVAFRQQVLEVPGGVKVILWVQQDNRITEVKFRGAVAEDEEDLKELLGIVPGMIPAPYVLGVYADMLVEHYRSKGYYLAQVNIWLEPAERGTAAVFEIFEGDKVTVQEIDFVGNEGLDEGDLEGQMSTSTPTLWIFTTKLKRDVLQKDIVKLNEFARREGFLDARISLEEVRLDEERNDAAIVVRVQEGPRYRVDKVAVRFGTPENPRESAEFSEAEILELVETAPGDFFYLPRIERDRKRIEKFYGERGYIRARVPSPAEQYAEKDPRVSLTYWVDEDKKKWVRDVIVAGNTVTKDKVIRREVSLNPGDLFTSTEMEWTKNSLNALQFFVGPQGQPRVLVEPRRTPDENYEDLYVEVEEGKTGFFLFTIGASTDGGIFGGTRIIKRNFDLTDLPSSPWASPAEFFSNEAFHGGGQTLQLTAMPGQVFSQYDLSFTEPYFIDTLPNPISFTLNAYIRETDYDDYDVERTGINPVFGKKLSREWSVSLGFRNELIEVTDVEDDAPIEAKEIEGNTGKTAAEAALRYRKVDNPYDPKKGFSAGLSWEYMGGVLGNDLEMNRAVYDNTVHVPLYETLDGTVHKLILNGTVGWEHEQADMDEIPIIEHFFAGGSSGLFPIRGFEWREVGPRSGDDPLGGEFAYALSAEYMVPLYSTYDPYWDVETTILRGVIFIDAGTVATDIHEWEEIREMRSSYGVGLRITLPVFAGLPIALDYGIPWKDYPGDERRSFSFNIQHWF